MGNAKLEIEFVGGHGYAREVKNGELIPYDQAHESELDNICKRLVGELQKNSSVVSATLTHWPESTPVVDDLLASKRVVRDFTQAWVDEPKLQFFAYSHLATPEMQAVSKRFREMAYLMVAMLPRNAERTLMLNDLLSAKDKAVRALIMK